MREDLRTAEAGRRPLRADAARNRQALLEAAQRLFAARGLCVTLDEIAADAGVNVATAYRHFANKHELATAILQQKIDEAIAIAEDAAAAQDSWHGLTEFFRRTLDLMTAHRGLHDVLMPGLADDWFQRFDDRIEPLLERILTRAQRAGRVRGELQPGDLGVILQMLAALSDIPTGDPTAFSRRYLELLLAGLRPGEPPLPGSPPTPAQVRQAATAPAGGRRGR